MSKSPFREPGPVDRGEPAGFPASPPVIASRKIIEATRRQELARAESDFHATIAAPRARAHAVVTTLLFLVAAFLVVFLFAFCAAQP